MVPRRLAPHVQSLAKRWPVVTITGPRQSGKTTLCRSLFPEHAYVSLEAPDVRAYAETDPRGLLAEHGAGAVLDEIQRVPALLSYLQVEVDRDPRPGRFILTGSAHFSLLEGVTQSLAGRTALVHLLPLSLPELRQFPQAPGDLFSTLWSGGYPAIYDRTIPAGEWFASYLGTYVERDVRQVVNVGDLSTFQTFLRLCAGRSGQLLNLSQLGSDTGISHNTVKSWLSVLETGFIAFRLRPFFSNLGVREVKTPKLYFYDSGLACALLGIRSAEELIHHPLRGPIFEGWVIAEVLKARFAEGVAAGVFFFRDRKGVEADLVVERGPTLVVAEVKSGRTLTTDTLAALDRVERNLKGSAQRPALEKVVVYGGDEIQRRTLVTALPWSRMHEHPWA